MFQIVEPDYKIHISITDEKVTGIEWGEIWENEGRKYSIHQLKRRLGKYLRQAQKKVDRL